MNNEFGLVNLWTQGDMVTRLVALLLLGKAPLQRAMAYVGGWALANALAIVVLTLLGETFSISLNHGEREQVLIDLLGAGALVGLGLYQLTPQANLGEEGMALRLMNQLPDFSTLSLVLIGATSALWVVLLSMLLSVGIVSTIVGIRA